MSPGKKSPSSSPASSGLLQTRQDAVTPQPHHPVLDKAPEPGLAAQETYSRHGRFSCGSCPAFLEVWGGLVLQLQAAWETPPSLAGESTAGWGPYQSTCLLPRFQDY